MERGEGGIRIVWDWRLDWFAFFFFFPSFLWFGPGEVMGVWMRGCVFIFILKFDSGLSNAGVSHMLYEWMVITR